MEAFTVIDLTHPVGPRVILPDSTLGIFQLFLTMEVIEMIVEQTNLYAYQCMGDTAFEAWQKVTAAELEAFFGFMILMGIVMIPLYWITGRMASSSTTFQLPAESPEIGSLICRSIFTLPTILLWFLLDVKGIIS